jgi:large conductance mechanosensitive channel
MGFLKEFRDFAVRGNVIDLAVGVIIGAAFTKIVNSLIENLINPVLGLFGGINFSEKYVMVGGPKDPTKPITNYAEAKANGVTFGYGAFITDIINFVIMAFIVFLIIKAINTARKRFERQPDPAAPAAPTERDYLREIRDLLAQQQRHA